MLALDGRILQTDASAVVARNPGGSRERWTDEIASRSHRRLRVIVPNGRVFDLGDDVYVVERSSALVRRVGRHGLSSKLDRLWGAGREVSGAIEVARVTLAEADRDAEARDAGRR